MNYLIDTNAIIYYLKGNAKIINFCSIDKLYISFITKIEVLSYEMSAKEKQIIHKFLEICKVVYIDDTLIDSAIKIIKETGLKLPDAIIVSTAKEKDSIIITADKQILKKSIELNINTIDPL